MPIFSLDEYTEAFLKRQKLEGFEITFKPFMDKSGRRAKKGNTMIMATDPSKVRKLDDRESVEDLIALLHASAQETKDWVEGQRRYAIKVTDDWGDPVRKGELLGDLRRRPQERQAAYEAKAHKLLDKAFVALEDLVDAEGIPAMVRQRLQARYGA
jgi:hypothetical protein